MSVSLQGGWDKAEHSIGIVHNDIQDVCRTSRLVTALALMFARV